jgi:hypothetical protein
VAASRGSGVETPKAEGPVAGAPLGAWIERNGAIDQQRRSARQVARDRTDVVRLHHLVILVLEDVAVPDEEARDGEGGLDPGDLPPRLLPGTVRAWDEARGSTFP